MPQSYEVIIIGAGTAGLSAVREIRRHTERFLLVDTGPYGTTCARVGCMPSKALIEAANACAGARRLAGQGLCGAVQPSVNGAAVLRAVRAQRDHYVAGVLRQIQALGAHSITGKARLLGPGLVDVDGSRYQGDAIVIATGSRPVLPDPWSTLGERILTSESLFEQEELPRRLAVIGLGAIGLEMAQAAARLGVAVHGFEASEFIGGLTDPVVNRRAIEVLGEEFPLCTGTSVRLTPGAAGVTVQGGDVRVEVDRVLVAVGRRPNLAGLDLEALGVELDEHGLPPFDPCTGQVGDLRVFIAGDVSAHAPLLHEAADEGYLAGYNAVRSGITRFRRRTPLMICFSAPHIAAAGRSYARTRADATVIGEVDFAGQGRARMTGEDRGCLRVYAEPATGRVRGAELCAPQGEHLAHLLAWVVQRRLTVFDVLELPFYHPTVEEALRSAMRDVKRHCGAARRPELALCEGLPYAGLD